MLILVVCVVFLIGNYVVDRLMLNFGARTSARAFAFVFRSCLLCLLVCVLLLVFLVVVR